MAVTYFSTINSFGKLSEISGDVTSDGTCYYIARSEIPLFFMKGSESCPSITDKSEFVPMKELIKKNLVASGNPQEQGLYDFPDGRDNGFKVPVSRMKGADIAEIQKEVERDMKEGEASMKAAKRREELAQEFAAAKAEGAAKAVAEKNINTGTSGPSLKAE